MLNDLLEYIERLESESFVGWSQESKDGYLTACCSIKEKLRKLEAKGKFRNFVPGRSNGYSNVECEVELEDFSIKLVVRSKEEFHDI